MQQETEELRFAAPDACMLSWCRSRLEAEFPSASGKELHVLSGVEVRLSGMVLSSEASCACLPSLEQVSGCSPEELMNLEALLEEEAKRSQVAAVQLQVDFIALPAKDVGLKSPESFYSQVALALPSGLTAAAILREVGSFRWRLAAGEDARDALVGCPSQPPVAARCCGPVWRL